MSNCYDPSGNLCRAAPCIPHFEEAMLPIRTALINKQVRMASSQLLRKLESLTVIKEPGQGSNNVGGPGNAIKSLQISTNAGIKGNKLRAVNYGKNGSQGCSGVDRKHGSYVRYLNRKVGSILRAEPLITRTALIGQPRSRTGTTCGCGIRTSVKIPDICCGAHIITSSGNWLPDPSIGMNAGFLLEDFTSTSFGPFQTFKSINPPPPWTRDCCRTIVFNNAKFDGAPILGLVTFFNIGTGRWDLNIYWQGQLTPPTASGIITNHTTGIVTTFPNGNTVLSNWTTINIGPVSVGWYQLPIGDPVPISVGDSFTVVFS